MKLNDSVIAHIVKLIQLGFLQGLDVVDYFRQIRLQNEDGELFLDPTYAERHEKEVQALLERVESHDAEETQSSEDSI